MRAAPVTSLDSRRLAVVAALRAVRDEPIAPARLAPAVVEQRAVFAALQAEVRRLADRVERLEDSIELLRDDAEPVLNWPTPVNTDSPLDVPPLEVSRRPSPAFDVLLGPAPTVDLSAAERPIAAPRADKSA